MSVDRTTIQLGLCPSPGGPRAIEYETPQKEIIYEHIDDMHLLITIPLIRQGRTVSDRIITLALCPEGQMCGCDYDTDLDWEILDGCGAQFSWTWPAEAG